MNFNPPFKEKYKVLFKNSGAKGQVQDNNEKVLMGEEECELPLIDMNSENQCIIEEIGKAAKEWGFFQVKNHGIPLEILERMLCQEKNVFYQDFKRKSEAGFLNLPANSYRWGNPKATCLKQLSWSEAFHVSLSDISKMHHYHGLRSTIQAFGEKAAVVAEKLAEILAKNIGIETNIFKESCNPSNCYIRMNRYPKQECGLSSEIYGLVPHTDSGFLTILYQDQTGGLQVKKDGKWRSVNPPTPDAIIVNTGDLFQAITNDGYTSVQHGAILPKNADRFSVAFFYCPSSDVAIESSLEPRLYKKFSFREYKQKVQNDIEATGDKLGLSSFLL
ncbi:2-oxoglutarate (2OG) and Fe(II)-dependent oxygenase superfamily protein [Euphorbia peplus]|nr:2-oxoglutarate (2OG) and Fe(II)-dependent oxygenase superfamily protein [Euphorbia peplus]